MSDVKSNATEEIKKPTSSQDSSELTEQELEGAAGGINPQPLPPMPRMKQ